MVHKPKHKVHSFRGRLADGAQDEINLERQNVNLAYRIVKFELIGATPGSMTIEGVVKIYKEEQTSIDGNVNFTDPDLLAAGYYVDNSGVSTPAYETIVFDNTLFSRNIWVTGFDASVGETINYYIELEEVPVGAATLMQIKLGTARRLGGPSMGN